MAKNIFTKNYLPVARIMRNTGMSEAGILVGNRLNQISFAPDTPRIRLAEGTALVLDFGIELVGGVALVVTSPAGRLRLRFGESVNEVMGEPDQTHAIHDTELQTPRFGTFEYGQTGFRFIRIDAINEIELLNVMAVSCECDVEFIGQFECSDVRLNRIWETARRTVHLCMGNYIFDGAKRDRMVWMGDLYPEIKSILAAFGGHRIITDSLDFVRNDTALPRFMNNISSYSLWWVVCQHEYYRYSGETAYLAAQQEYLSALLLQFAQYVENDGAENIPARRFLDWPSDDKADEVHAGLQGLMLLAFRCGEELASALHDDKLQEHCNDVISRLAAHNPSCNLNKTAAALQVLGGIADHADVLVQEPLKGISTFGGSFVLDALARQGKYGAGLHLIRNYWGAMVDRGATTFWEDFDLNWLENSGRIDEFTPAGVRDLHADFGNYCYKGLRHSLCHGWGSAPCSWLMDNLLGVRFALPGGRGINFAPNLEDLEYMRGSIPTPDGIIEVIAESGHTPEIKLPKGMIVTN